MEESEEKNETFFQHFYLGSGSAEIASSGSFTRGLYTAGFFVDPGSFLMLFDFRR